MRSKTKSNTMRAWGGWIVLLLVAALLRIPHADWDAGIAAHPDERYIIGVMQDTPLYDNPAVTSEAFAYGHLPVTIARLIYMCAPSADPLYALRIISALVGILIVAAGIKLSMQTGSREVAALAGIILSFSPLLIQHAHYYTVDTWATLFGVLSLLAVLNKRWGLAGVNLGLALSSKISMVWVAAPLLAGLLLQSPKSSLNYRGVMHNRMLWRRFIPAFLLTYALSSPWTIMQPWISWQGVYTQSLIVSGRFAVPFTAQYTDTIPWLYPLWQMGLWGLGFLPMLCGAAGIVYTLLRWRKVPRKVGIASLYALVYFAGTAGVFVKFPRYMLPVYPVWAVFAAMFAQDLAGSRWRRWLYTLMIVLQVSLGFAQVIVYAQPHPWITASEWLYAHTPATAVLAVEEWDHPLPVNVLDNGITRQQVTIPVWETEGATKQRALLNVCTNADVIILASRRGYGAQCRMDCDSPTMAWYRQIFAERYVTSFARCPQLLGIAIVDDPLRDSGIVMGNTLAQRCGTRLAIRLPRLDESFRVYDSPTVVILER